MELMGATLVNCTDTICVIRTHIDHVSIVKWDNVPESPYGDLNPESYGNFFPNTRKVKAIRLNQIGLHGQMNSLIS